MYDLLECVADTARFRWRFECALELFWNNTCTVSL